MARPLHDQLLLSRSKGFSSFVSCLILSKPQPKAIQSLFFHLTQFQYVMIFLWLQLSLISSTATNAFAEFTMKFTNLINIKDFLLSHYQEWSFSAIWIGVWIYFFIFLLTWLIILIRLKTLKKSSTPSIWEKINHYISQMHFSIFFWLINMALTLKRSGGK